ncbi:MAG: hypothetical protein AAF063_33555 [Cyanobacteria bacterium J06643_5]
MGIIGKEKSVAALRQAMLNPSGGCDFDPVLELEFRLINNETAQQ